MSLFDDILWWATSELSDWQRDTLRRLVQKQELDPQDIDDLYAMMKASRGIPDHRNRKALPLAKEHLPVQAANMPTMVLHAIRDLKHVNRIAAGRKIQFAPKGITVVYGGNASGKSGYSRVLKRACRARDLTETVHPDASNPKSSSAVPEAIFEVEIGGKAVALRWQRDVPPPDELSTISVFDGRCARAYLDNEQELAYLPYGLDIVETLAQKILPALARRLEAEMAAINTDITPFVDLAGETNVGKLIASLSATTDPQSIRNLATLTPADTLRLAELNGVLAESNPRAKAQSLRLSAQRLDGLTSRIDSATVWVDDAAIVKLRTCDDEALSASQAETLAAEAFRAAEPLLPGTGQQVWKDLLEAARRYSTEVVHPGKPFPQVEEGSRCPLCQQLLDEAAAKRMRRFEEYVKQDTAKVAAERRDKHKIAIARLGAATVSFGFDAAITEEIAQLDSGVLNPVRNYEHQVGMRKAWLLRAINDHAWVSPPTLPLDPRPSLKALSEKLVAQAVHLEKVDDAKHRQLIEYERAELQARRNLSLRQEALIALVERMRINDALAACKSDLNTKPISDKAREFADKAVTTGLKNALNSEFQKMGIGCRIKVKFTSRVERGRPKLKLVLDLPVTKPLGEILSEGEQRVIAIGSFLAEVHLAGHKDGIVFDDPVSSLDHHWRKNVACRLVDEAKTRQVIVFTHDTVFLGELRDMSELQDVNCLMYHLEWVNDCPGHVTEGLPWEHQSYRDRLDKLQKAQKALEKGWPQYPGANDRNKMRHEYNLLRATIERVIQDVVFNGVIERYRDWVKVGKLGDVAGLTKSECDAIIRLHNACSDVVDAHDPSSAKNAAMPGPAQLGKDIHDLKTVVELIKARRKP